MKKTVNNGQKIIVPVPVKLSDDCKWEWDYSDEWYEEHIAEKLKEDEVFFDITKKKGEVVDRKGLFGYKFPFHLSFLTWEELLKHKVSSNKNVINNFKEAIKRLEDKNEELSKVKNIPKYFSNKNKEGRYS